MSRDFNKIHSQIFFAKNIGLQNLVVHGVHQLFKLIETYEVLFNNFDQLKANFLLPLSVDEEFRIIKSEENGIFKFVFLNDNKVFSEFLFLDDEPEPIIPNKVISQDNDNDRSNLKSFVSYKDNTDFELFKTIFPNMCRQFHQSMLIEFLFSSYLIGEIYELTDSMLVSLSVTLMSKEYIPEVDSIKVKSDTKSLILNMKNDSYRIKAVARKINYFNYDKVIKFPVSQIKNRKFENSLIVGGTGALGMSFASILIKNGFKVTLSYRNEEKLAELKEKLSFLDLNRTNFFKFDTGEKNEIPDSDYTHVFYCLSPKIFHSNNGEFSDLKYQQFLNSYIHTPKFIYDNIDHTSLNRFVIPSTSMLNDQALVNASEYMISKKEMEIYFKELNDQIGEVFFLPRISGFQSTQYLDQSNKLESPFKIAEMILGLV